MFLKRKKQKVHYGGNKRFSRKDRKDICFTKVSFFFLIAGMINTNHGKKEIMTAKRLKRTEMQRISLPVVQCKKKPTTFKRSTWDQPLALGKLQPKLTQLHA